MKLQNIQRYRQILEQNPGDVQALSDLGNTLMATGQVAAAERCFRQLLNLLPDSAETLANIAMALRMQGDLLQAEQFLRKAVNLRLDNCEMRYQLAATLAGLGQLEQSLSLFDQALDINPGFNNARIGKACVLELDGQYQRAYTSIQEVLSKEVNSIQAILLFARLSPRFGNTEKAIRQLEAVLASKTLTPDEIRQVHITLGKLFDGLGKYDKAFRHYRQYNELKGMHFDPAAHRRSVDDIITSCGEEFSQAPPVTATTTTELIFIIGLPRTGTTLAEQILASHPAIHAGGELPSLETLVDTTLVASGAEFPGAMSTITHDMLEAIANVFLEQVNRASAAKRYFTVNARGNEKYLGLIARLFPDARVVHCTRDPLDSCLSCYFQDLTTAHAYACDLEHLGLYYNQYVRLMQYWKRALKIPMYDMEYEALIERPDTVIPRLIQFCSLEWDDQCLRFYENRRSITTPSHEQVRKPLYTSSVSRWRNYEKHLKPLIEALTDSR